MSAVQTGMHSLPTEIKQQIARCCANQDAVLASALKEIRDENAAVHVLCPRQDALRRAVAQNQSLGAPRCRVPPMERACRALSLRGPSLRFRSLS
jgi:hypothetical protein